MSWNSGSMCEGRGFEDGVASALAGVEIALRLAVRAVFPNWQEEFHADQLKRLEKARRTERNKKEGVQASEDLLDYLELHKLVSLIQNNWSKFEPVFGDEQQTKVLLSLVCKFRNSVAHSRDLVKFEQNLVRGVSGMLRNQVSMFRTSSENAARYYPVIESLVDSFGRPGSSGFNWREGGSRQRIDIGCSFSVIGRASAARGKEIRWYAVWTDNGLGAGDFPGEKWDLVAAGEEVQFNVEVDERAIGEEKELLIAIAADSKYHRSTSGWDDLRTFYFSVSPPDDE